MTTTTTPAAPKAATNASKALTQTELRTNPPACMSLKEAAVYIGISERFLHTETHRPGSSLRASKIGRRLIYQKANVDRWLQLHALAA